MQEEVEYTWNKTKKIGASCIMKRAHVWIPKPGSKFQRVQCKECGEENVVYSHVSSIVTCKACGNTLAEPTGSICKPNGKILGSAD
jgi:small subunit ribosomal protein S27e